MYNQAIIERLQELVNNGLTVKVHNYNTPPLGVDGVLLVPLKLSEYTMHLYLDSTDEEIKAMIEKYEEIHRVRKLYETRTVSKLLESILINLNLQLKD